MQNIQDLEKILNSELNTKIKSSFIKHNQIYLKIDDEYKSPQFYKEAVDDLNTFYIKNYDKSQCIGELYG